MQDRKRIEETYFSNGHWSIIKSENRRAALKKERRTALENRPKTKDYSQIFKSAVSLAARITDSKESKIHQNLWKK